MAQGCTRVKKGATAATSRKRCVGPKFTARGLPFTSSPCAYVGKMCERVHECKKCGTVDGMYEHFTCPKCPKNWWREMGQGSETARTRGAPVSYLVVWLCVADSSRCDPTVFQNKREMYNHFSGSAWICYRLKKRPLNYTQLVYSCTRLGHWQRPPSVHRGVMPTARARAGCARAKA